MMGTVKTLARWRAAWMFRIDNDLHLAKLLANLARWRAGWRGERNVLVALK